MSNKNIIRAWKDPVYRSSLSERERAALPPNPAGAIEISDADLGKVAGGLDTPNSFFCTICPTYTCTAICSVLCNTNVFTCPPAPHK
jgi:mersacidin/lichenicidin family type 2 lantibiotic